MKRLLFLVLCTGFFAREADAQSFEFWGDISISLNSIDDNNAIARVDAMLAIPLASVGERQVSFEFGTFAYFLKGDRPHETYAALVLDDRWRVGAVRPAYDLALPSVFAFAAPSVANTRAEYVRAHATTEAMRFNSVPWGVSYTAEAGKTEWAISAHDASPLQGGFRSASVAAVWQDAPFQLAFAVEGVWDPRNSFDGINAKVGGRWVQGDWDLGVAFLHPDANSRPDAVAIDVTYSVLSRVDLSVFGEITEDPDDDAYGMAAIYEITPASDIGFAATTTGGDGEFHLTYTRRY